MNILPCRANLSVPAILPAPILTPVFRRGGRAVDCAGLENRKAERPREFESHPLRQLGNEVIGSPLRGLASRFLPKIQAVLNSA
jgi:hypothetical protein